MMFTSLEVVTGPMFSGKTSELVRRIEREVYAKRPAAIFKPSLDMKYSESEVITHNGLRYGAFIVPADRRGAKAIYEGVRRMALEVVGIDEVQFFTNNIVKMLDSLAQEGIRVLVAGVNLNHLGEPFKATKELLAIADRITLLTAVCVKCGKEATRTQRLIGGKPAPRDSPLFMPGGLGLYEPRCRACFEVVK